MHPDLSPHLHTDECNIIISEFKQCHQENKFKRFLGVCSDLERSVYKCVMREREANRKKNKEEGERKRAEMRKKTVDL